MSHHQIMIPRRLPRAGVAGLTAAFWVNACGYTKLIPPPKVGEFAGPEAAEATMTKAMQHEGDAGACDLWITLKDGSAFTSNRRRASCNTVTVQRTTRGIELQSTENPEVHWIIPWDRAAQLKITETKQNGVGFDPNYVVSGAGNGWMVFYRFKKEELDRTKLFLQALWFLAEHAPRPGPASSPGATPGVATGPISVRVTVEIPTEEIHHLKMTALAVPAMAAAGLDKSVA